jgi:hypothetical protein
MAEMNWNEMKTGGSGEGTPFLKLQPGPNQTRIVGLPYETEIHWEAATDGSKKRVVCPGVGCPVCKAGHVPQKKFQVLVIDRADKKLKILEGGVSIFKQIKELAMDPDYGDPSKYDVKIKKEGQGRETKYTILASPNKSALTQEETTLLDGAKALSEVNKPKSIEDIILMDLEVLAGSADFNGGWADGDNTTVISADSTPTASKDDWDDL